MMSKISKQKRPVVVCAILFVVLLIAYFAVVRPLVNSGLEAEETEPLETVEGEVIGINDRYLMFPQVERKNMQSIKVENEYGTYEFYRDANGDFQIRGFEGTSFDLTKFSSLVTSCGYTLAKVKVVDNATDAELQEYGLDKPAASWTLTTLTGQQYKVYVGYDLLTGGGYYCMLEGRRSVYVLDTALKDSVLAPIESLCSPILLAGITQQDYFEIDNFTVMHGEDVLCSFKIVDKAEQNNPDALVENRMSYPAPYFPNEDILYDIYYRFMSLSGTSVMKLGVSDADYEKYGLVNPAHTVYFEFKGAQVILLFSEKQEGGFYYAASSLFPDTVVSIDAATVDFLDYGLIDWITDYPFQQWITAVSAVEVKGSGADVKFELSHSVQGENTAILDVQCSNGLYIKNEDVYNFRQFYKTLLSIAIQDYADLTDDEIKKLTSDEKNNILTFTLTNLAGEKTVYRFYPYSGTGRRALMTINGEGEFYVQTDLIEKIASDANKVLSGLDINSYGKN